MINDATNKKAHPLNDVYSFGIILYTLVTGGLTDKGKVVSSFAFREKQWSSVSEELLSFVQACVAIDIDARQKSQ